MTTEVMTGQQCDHHDDDHQHHADQTDIFGFWIYIMSDCLLFASLFAAFIILRQTNFGGAALKYVANLPYVLAETIFLLCSSFTYGMAILNSYHGKMNKVISWLIITVIFGLCFVGMELSEFIHLCWDGRGPQASGFYSGFLTLVGTHGFHVSMGILWMIILIVQLFIYGDCPKMLRRLTYLGLFWAFLDIVWIFVFTIVYLMGAV